MKKIKLLSLITSFALIFSLLSCGGGDEPGGNTPTEDKTLPVANNIIPANNAVISIDGNGEGQIDFKADLSDNESLASYTIDIHQNVPGHTDPSSTTRSIDKVAFSYSKTFTDDVKGKKTASVSQNISVSPVNNQPMRMGSYHHVLTVTDTSGNKQVTINEIFFNEE